MAAMASSAKKVTSMGMMLPQVAVPEYRLKEARPTRVELSTTRPAFCNPRNAMNRPIPAGMAIRTADGMASKILRRRPVMVSRVKMMPSASTSTRALA